MSARRRRFVSATVAALLLVGGGLFAVLRPTGDSETEPETPPVPTFSPVAPDPPDPVAAAFLTAWAAEDWTTLDALATDLSAAERHAEWVRAIEAASVGLTLGEVTRLDDQRALAVFDVSVEIAETGTWGYESQMTLIWDGAAWLVDWNPNLLHPSLAGDDRLVLVRNWPERAPILGRDGTPLVTTLPTVRVGVIPNRVTSRAEVREAFERYTEIPGSKIDEVMDAPNVQPDWFLPITVVPRESYPDVRPELYPVPGVAFRVTEGRAPVEQGLALQVLGTTGEITAELLDELAGPYRTSDVVGRTPSSLERTHERSLAGSPTTEILKMSAAGDTELVHSFPGEPAIPLATTLSLQAQRAAEAALEGVETPAALVAVDIATGEIRAAVSRPIEGFNRAFTGLYPPGSTFKLVITLAALESGFTRESTLSCPQEITIGGQVFHNAVTLPETLSLEQALIQSCNTAFMQLAGEMDRTTVEETARKLGFNIDYTIGLAVPAASYPLPQSSNEAAAAAIGQASVQASPLHMASVVAALAGDGWRPPTILARDPVTPADPIDPAIAATIQELMVRVVEDRNGTGRNAAVDDVTVGGKTGTAQLGSEEDDPLVAWFVGFSEGLAFAVMVEEGESGGRSAAPLAAAFLEALDDVPDSGASLACTDATQGWATFQGSGARTGCATGVEPVTDPAVRWSAEVGIQAWLNNPIVVDDLVIVGTAGRRRGIGDDQDGVVALRLGDGEVEWRFGANGDVNGVSASGSTVVATGDEGKVWGINASNGKVRWTFDEAETLVFTNPLIVDGLVVVGDAGGGLWGLDLDDGDLRWKVPFSDSIRGGAATDGRLVFAADEAGQVIAVDLDGRVIWERELALSDDSLARSVSVWAAPTVVGDTVVISVVEEGSFTGPAVVALDKYVGTERWRGADAIGAGWSNLRNSPALLSRQLAFAGSLTTGVQAVDASSGSAVWTVETPVVCDVQWASLVVVGDQMLFARTSGALVAVDGSTREVLWQLALTDDEPDYEQADCSLGSAEILAMQLQATPAIAPDGTILVGSLGGWLYAVEQGS
jgi:cell division protein FtsI/penicillin-binding protein 2/outer membrane protein assembly factor BamB